MSTLHPLCLLCFSACDKEGCLTSCDHYFCSRCAGRLPNPSTGAPCPLCRKPFRTVRLDHAGVQQLLSDPLPGIQASVKALQHQLSHYRQACVRLKEALRLVHNRYTAGEVRTAELQQNCERLRVENEQICQQLRHAEAVAAPVQPTRVPYGPSSGEARGRQRQPSMQDLSRSHSRALSRPSHTSPLHTHSPWSQPPASGVTTQHRTTNTVAHSSSNAAAGPPPLGWAATSVVRAKRYRSHSNDDHQPQHTHDPSPLNRGDSARRTWGTHHVSETGHAAAALNTSDSGSAANEARAGNHGGGGGGDDVRCAPRDGLAPSRLSTHMESPDHFRMATPLAQSLQRQHVHVPDSAVVPPTPRLFAARDPGGAVTSTSARRSDSRLPSAPKPLQGLLDACFRTPR